MDLMEIRKIADQYMESKYNHIASDIALTEDLRNVRMFDDSLIGVAKAADPMFVKLQEPQIIGPHFRLPDQWLPEAQSVLSFFFPFSQVIRDSNKVDMTYPSPGWLHGRIEGQEFIKLFAKNMVDSLVAAGCRAVAPSIDDRFFANLGKDAYDVHSEFTSNWSERHVAYTCGLGTFSLSKGLITEKGIAGRFTSVITDAILPANGIPYSTYDENCILCGKCIKNCPAQAISFEHGKNHKLCAAFLNKVKAENFPRLGCGKCQVNVPCEHQIPKKRV